MFTLVSKPYSKTKQRLDTFSVAKPIFWSSVALYLVAFALPVGTGRFGESGFLAFTYGVFLCLRAPWLRAGWKMVSTGLRSSSWRSVVGRWRRLLAGLLRSWPSASCWATGSHAWT